MFTTFIGTPQSPNQQQQQKHSAGGSAPPQQRQQQQPGPTKQKRHQVARACDWCRVQRVKCDSNVPCGNCQSRSRSCSNRSSGEFRTLPHACREIEHLRQKIRDLESQLEDERSSARSTALPTPAASTVTHCSSHQEDIRTTFSRRHWEGVHVSTAYSRQRMTWYGPLSLLHFISRMNTYLSAALEQPHLEKHVQPNTVARSFWSPDCNNLEDNDTHHPQKDDHLVQPGQNLSPVQEEYFLNLFWQSYHSSLPVLNEVEFKEHCRSLWTQPGKPRKPSALVDIVIAMSMQYGMAIRPRSLSGTEVHADDPTIAGRWYYRRCQSLLCRDLESPTIRTVQCQLLSVIYLCCASFQNMAHSTLALAVRTAEMLGLHVEPPAGMPHAERELRKRLWWSIYIVESKTCMKLGRPFSADLRTITCQLPADDHGTASSAGSDFAPLDEHATWLTYNLQNTKLVLASRSVYTALYDACLDISPGESEANIHENPAALKRCSDSFSSSMQALASWAQGVPAILKTNRRGDGVSLSTDLSPLEVEQFAPLWLQRQRLLLELLYHNLAMNLHRVFITFPMTLTGTTTSSHATSAVDHAMAITQMMHQIMTQTDLLSGWHEAFQWQWNAAVTLVGYLLASPTPSSASLARQAVGRALVVFEVFGRSFAAAASAATVVRDLVAKADLVKDQTPPESTIGGNGDPSKTLQDATMYGNATTADLAVATVANSSDGTDLSSSYPRHFGDGMLSWMDELNAAAMQEVLSAQAMDLTFMGDGSDGVGGEFDMQFFPVMSM